MQDVFGYRCVASDADMSQLIMDDLKNHIYVKGPTNTNLPMSLRYGQIRADMNIPPFSWETSKPGNLKIFSSTRHHPLTTGRLLVVPEEGYSKARGITESIPQVKQSCCPSTFMGTHAHQLQQEIERSTWDKTTLNGASIREKHSDGTAARVSIDQRDASQPIYLTNNSDNNQLMTGIKAWKELSFHLETSQRVPFTPESFDQNKFSATYDSRFKNNHSSARWWSAYRDYNLGKIGSVMGTRDTRQGEPDELGCPPGPPSPDDKSRDAFPPYDTQEGRNPKRFPKPYDFLEAQAQTAKTLGGVLACAAADETPLALTIPLKELPPSEVPRNFAHFRKIFGADMQDEYEIGNARRESNSEPTIADPFYKRHPRCRPSDDVPNQAFRCNPRLPTYVMNGAGRYHNGDRLGDIFISPLRRDVHHRRSPANQDYVLVMKPPHVIEGIRQKYNPNCHDPQPYRYRSNDKKSKFLACEGRPCHYVKDATNDIIKIYRSQAHNFAVHRSDWFFFLPQQVLQNVRDLVGLAGENNCPPTREHYASNSFEPTYPDQSRKDPNSSRYPHVHYGEHGDDRPVRCPGRLTSEEYVDATGRITRTRSSMKRRRPERNSSDDESENPTRRPRQSFDGASIESDTSTSESSYVSVPPRGTCGTQNIPGRHLL